MARPAASTSDSKNQTSMWAPSSAKMRSKSTRLHCRVRSHRATKAGSLVSQRWKVALTSSCQVAEGSHQSRWASSSCQVA